MNIAGFDPKKVKSAIFGADEVFDILPDLQLYQLARLEENGVVFIKGLDENGDMVAVVARYQDEVIAAGKKETEVRDALKSVLGKQGDDLVEGLDFMAKRKFSQFRLKGKLINASTLRQYRGQLKKKGGHLFLEEDLLNKALTREFKPVMLEGFKFETLSDLFYFMRNEGFAGCFDARTRQMFLRHEVGELPTQYLTFHEMMHLRHFEEIGDAYHGLKAWQKETYVFEQIWKNKGIFNEGELKHALKYVNQEREKAGIHLLNYKL